MFYSFGEYFLDLETRKLSHDNVVVSDDEKTIQLLQQLCQSYPEVAEKQPLIDALWPDQVVTDWSLSRLVSDTRQMLGDSGKDQGYIKTVRGRGFRLNTSVQKSEKRTSAPAISALMHSQEKSTSTSNKYKIYGYLASLFIFVTIAVILLKPNPSSAIPEFPLRVAILPVSGSNNEPIDEWLKYGIMSMMSEQLDQYEAINSLPVASVITAMATLGEDFSQQIMGEEQFESICAHLGCSHLVVVKYGLSEDKRQSLSYQIIRKNSRSAINEFSKQDVMDTADMLIDHLSTDLLPSETSRLSLKQTYSVDNKANRDYAIGVHELHSGDIASAKIYLELALKRQADFFWAQAYLAEVDYREGKLKKAQQQVTTLKSSTQDEDKLFFLSHLNSNILYNQDKLEESLAQSKELLGNVFVSGNEVLQGIELLNIGSTLQALNRPDHALIFLNQSMESFSEASYSPGVGKAHYNIANVYLNTDRFEQALVQYKKAREAFKRCSMTGYALMAKHRVATTSTLLGKYQHAKSELENLIAEYQMFGDEEGVILASLDLVTSHFETENFDIALAKIEKLLKKLENTEFHYYNNQALGIAVRTSLMLGNIEKAESYFVKIDENQRKDFRVGFVFMPAFILHAKGELQAAVDKAKQIKAGLGEQWSESHQQKLASLEKSLAAGEILEVAYKN